MRLPLLDCLICARLVCLSLLLSLSRSLFCCLSFRHPTPYTPHPSPCALHPIPYTLNATPYTLHPTPYTLNPKRSTLHATPGTAVLPFGSDATAAMLWVSHPKPQTLNSTPETLNPKPSTRNPQTQTLKPKP